MFLSSSRVPLSFLFVTSVMVVIIRLSMGNPYLIGDCPYYAATSVSLLEDGDFDLQNQLQDLSAHSGFVSISPKNGTIIPKHSTLMSFLSIPFYGLFGKTGFLVFNIVQLIIFFWGIIALGGNTKGARLTALLAGYTSALLLYAYNFSPDIFGATLLLWCYVCANCSRWIWCGLLAGLAVWAKVYLGLLLLPLAIVIVPSGWLATLKTVLAATIALCPMLLLHNYLYGHPLATGYDFEGRIAESGEIRIIEHYSHFNQPFLLGIKNLLFDEKIGLLQTVPLWFLWPIGSGFMVKRGQQRLAMALSLAIALNLVLFAFYDDWAATVFLNRFLFPAIAFGFAIQSPLWDALIARLNSKPVVTPTSL